MKRFTVAMLPLIVIAALLMTYYSWQGRDVRQDSQRVNNLETDILSHTLVNSADRVRENFSLTAPDNDSTDANLSASTTINIATPQKNEILTSIIEPTPDNADMPATGEFADQVNLKPSPCASDCADDWDEFAPAIGENSEQVNLKAIEVDEALPPDVGMDSHPSTVTGSYIDG